MSGMGMQASLNWSLLFQITVWRMLASIKTVSSGMNTKWHKIIIFFSPLRIHQMNSLAIETPHYWAFVWNPVTFPTKIPTMRKVSPYHDAIMLHSYKCAQVWPYMLLTDLCWYISGPDLPCSSKDVVIHSICIKLIWLLVITNRQGELPVNLKREHEKGTCLIAMTRVIHHKPIYLG